MSRVLFRHDASLHHDTGSHPERSARIVAVERELAEREWCGFEPRESPRATTAQLRAVHPASHLERIRSLAAVGGGAIDAETVVSPGSWEAAIRAAGGAVAMVDVLLGGEADRAAALHRPPGHHCETDRPMGFCLLNSVAVAARHARDAHGASRVLILDWDVHHGNGTAEIFAGTDEVLYCSIHQQPLYPGTGAATERGRGPGRGYTVNLPVPAGSGDQTWTAMIQRVVVPLVRAYAPELVLVSAGYDAHVDDPLADCLVTDAGFAAIAAAVHGVAADLDLPCGLVLEGGYDLGALSRSVAATLDVFSRAPAAATVTASAPPLVDEARAFVTASWPDLAVADR